MSLNNDDQEKLSQLYTEGMWSNIKAKTAAATQGFKNIGHMVTGNDAKMRTSESAKFRSSVNSLAEILAKKAADFSKNLEQVRSKIDPNSSNAKLVQELLGVGTAVRNRVLKSASKASQNLK